MLCYRAGTSKARHTSGSSQSGRSRERTESNNRFFHATTTSALMLLASKGENNSAWKKSLLDLKIFIHNMYVVGLSACSNIHAYLVSSFTIWRHNFSLLAFCKYLPIIHRNMGKRVFKKWHCKVAIKYTSTTFIHTRNVLFLRGKMRILEWMHLILVVILIILILIWSIVNTN